MRTPLITLHELTCDACPDANHVTTPTHVQRKSDSPSAPCAVTTLLKPCSCPELSTVTTEPLGRATDLLRRVGVQNVWMRRMKVPIEVLHMALSLITASHTHISKYTCK